MNKEDEVKQQTSSDLEMKSADNRENSNVSTESTEALDSDLNQERKDVSQQGNCSVGNAQAEKRKSEVDKETSSHRRLGAEAPGIVFAAGLIVVAQALMATIALSGKRVGPWSDDYNA
jgi:hypothetical protein